MRDTRVRPGDAQTPTPSAATSRLYGAPATATMNGRVGAPSASNSLKACETGL